MKFGSEEGDSISYGLSDSVTPKGGLTSFVDSDFSLLLCIDICV